MEHQDSNHIQQTQTAWKMKLDNPKYALYKNALADGLGKIGKYYSHLDEKPSTILALGKSSESIPSHY